MMKITLFSALLTACLWQPLAAADTAPVFELWPKGAPEPSGFTSEPETEVPKKTPDDVMRLTNVTKPTITLYKPEKPNGTVVIVCPGGGYKILAYEHEGTQTCEWLNSLGVTAVLLKYRVPARNPEKPEVEPVQDIQRAIGMVRHHAEEWGVKADRVGVLGFSAGGNLCALAAVGDIKPSYEFDEALDVKDVKPNFAMLIYPAYLTPKDKPFELKSDFKVTKESPQVLLIHAHDDPITPTGSALLYLEYKKAGVPAELLIFSKGGHGYGMKKSGNPVNEWPARAADWLKSAGLLD